ncbi:MAG: hypothetical protein ACOCOT_04075 [Prevotella sp.]
MEREELADNGYHGSLEKNIERWMEHSYCATGKEKVTHFYYCCHDSGEHDCNRTFASTGSGGKHTEYAEGKENIRRAMMEMCGMEHPS